MVAEFFPRAVEPLEDHQDLAFALGVEPLLKLEQPLLEGFELALGVFFVFVAGCGSGNLVQVDLGARAETVAIFGVRHNGYRLPSASV